MSGGTLPAPVAAWDPNLPGGTYWRHQAGASRWATAHLPGASDAPFAIVRMVRRNENGRCYTDPETGRLAVQPPVTVMLDALPPAELLS